MAVSESVEAGQIVANDASRPGELRPSAAAADPGVVGIVVGHPGFTWSDSAPIALAGSISCAAFAQTSASYNLKELVLNSDGDPLQGSVLSAPHYRVSLGTIGDAVVRAQLSSGSFRVDGGFAAAYPPPGEVQGFAFQDKATMQWSAKPSAGKYELYRNAISVLPGDFGACLMPGLTLPTAGDATTPAAGSGYSHLATARNRLGEEGTKGYRSEGTQRASPTPCP